MNLTPVETTYTPGVNFLHNEHFVVRPGGITIASGQNLAAGELLQKVTASGLYTKYLSTDCETAPTATVAGILMYAVNATSGAALGSELLHGFVKLATLPSAPDAQYIAAMSQISFI